MAVYVVTGKLGSGKTLCMVGRARDYIERGLPVATNIELDLGALVSKAPSAPVTRVPDRPSVRHFHALGSVHDTGQESKNGALILDEVGAWLNSRQWADKGRQAMIDWLLHSRKLGWDVYLIVQHLTLLDKQVREALAEYIVTCRRLDRLNVPGLSALVRAASGGRARLPMPQIHMAAVSYGTGLAGIAAETWWYRGRELYAAYQTVQVMREPSEDDENHALVWADPAAAAQAQWMPKPRLRAVELAAGLPRDEAWAVARRYSLSLDRGYSPSPSEIS